jgi:hypothetical protein
MSDELTLNYRVKSAATWLLVSELMRRHHVVEDLQLEYSHPGLSAHGLLRLRRPGSPGAEQPAIVLHMGGGDCGKLEVAIPFGVPRMSLAELKWPQDSHVLAVLGAADPKEVVDAIEAVAGLPERATLLPTTPPVLVARIISGFLQRQAFTRVTWRASCGFLDASNGSKPADWVSIFDEVASEVRSLRERSAPWEAVSKAAGRLWLLHRAAVHAGPAESLSDCDGDSVVLDMVTGRAISARDPRKRADMVQLYEEGGRRLDGALGWLGQVVGL